MVVSAGKNQMNGMVVTIMKHGVGKAKREMMEFHIRLCFEQGETTFKKRKKKEEIECVFHFYPLLLPSFLLNL